MRKIFFCLIILICASGVSAQKTRLRAAGSGKVSVIRGQTRSIIDLSEDVAGCPFINLRRGRLLIPSDCLAPPATFKLIDAIVKNRETFLIVQTEAMGNCNVCGFCGASEAYALVWLKLDARLKVVDKKSVTIDYCPQHISSLSVVPHEDDNLSDLKLGFKNDVLTVEYEKTLFNDNADISGYEFSHLEYNRKTPENGFVIKSEKREKSSNQE